MTRDTIIFLLLAAWAFVCFAASYVFYTMYSSFAHQLSVVFAVAGALPIGLWFIDQMRLLDNKPKDDDTNA